MWFYLVFRICFKRPFYLPPKFIFVIFLFSVIPYSWFYFCRCLWQQGQPSTISQQVNRIREKTTAPSQLHISEVEKEWNKKEIIWDIILHGDREHWTFLLLLLNLKSSSAPTFHQINLIHNMVKFVYHNWEWTWFYLPFKLWSLNFFTLRITIRHYDKII